MSEEDDKPVKVKGRPIGVQFETVLERMADGGYVARCPSLPGCVARGKTQKETLENMEEVIAHFLNSSASSPLDLIYENVSQPCVHSLVSHAGRLYAATSRDAVHFSPDGTFGSFITMPVTGASSPYFTPAPSSGRNAGLDSSKDQDDQDLGDYTAQIYCLEPYASFGANRLYAGTNAGGCIYVSEDGKRWDLAYNTGEDRVHALKTFKGLLYAGTSAQGLVYAYNGRTWSQAFDTGEAAVVSLGVHGHKLFLGTYPNGLILSSDDGARFQVALKTEHSFVQSFGSFKGWIYAGAARAEGLTIFRSKEGSNWEPVFSSDKDTNVYCFKEFGNVLYVGTGDNGRIYKTTDGENFQVAVATLEEGVRSMEVHEGRFFVATEPKGRIFRSAFAEPPPAQILNIKVEGASSYGAVISWETDSPCESTLEYGVEGPDEKRVQDRNLTKEHRLNLAGLKAATRYRFRPVATGRGGTVAVGAEGSFRTERVPSPLVKSPSHPNSESWTSKKDATFEISTGIRAKGILYLLDQVADSHPTPSNAQWTTESTVELKNLEDGNFWFHVVAQDEAGNFSDIASHYAIRVDTHAWPPKVASPTHGSSSTWYSNNAPRFTWEVENELSGVQGFYCCIDQEAGTLPDPQSGTWTTAHEISFPNLDDGTWFFHIISMDGSGNVGTEAAHFEIHIDTEAGQPELSCESHASQDRYYPSGDIKVSWRPPLELSGVAGYYYVLDRFESTYPDEKTGVWTKGTEKSFLNKEEGPWFFHLVAKDRAGNLSREAATLRILIDREAAPPDISSPSHPDQDRFYSARDVQVTLAPPQDLSGVEGYYYCVDTDGKTVPNPDLAQVTRSSSEPRISLHNLEEGVWYLHVVTRDKAGNVGKKAAHFRIQIDTSVGPVKVRCLSEPDPSRWIHAPEVQIEWEGSDEVSGIAGYYYIFDEESATIPDPHRGTYTEKTRATFEVRDDGIWYFHIVAVDKAGNVGKTVSHLALRVDTKAPEPEVFSPSHADQEAWSGDPHPRFEWRAEDPLSGTKGYYWLLSEFPRSGVEPAAWTYSEENRCQVPDVGDGEWIFHVATLDWAGNISRPAQRRIKIDTKAEAPYLASSSHPDPQKYSNAREAIVRISPPKDPAGIKGFLWILDAFPDTVPNPASGAFTREAHLVIPDLKDGDWVLHVATVDGVGNVSFDAAHLKIRVDATPPKAELRPLSPFSAERNFLVSWEGSDNLSGIEFYDVEVREGADEPFKPWLSRSALTESLFRGEDGKRYQFRVRALDRAGNIGPTQTGNEITVDVSPPSSITDLRTESRAGGDVALTWSAASDLSSGLSHYNIYRSPAPDQLGEKITEDGSVRDPGWLDRGSNLSDGAVYYYTVQAVDMMGHEQSVGNHRVPGLCAKSVDAPVVVSSTHPNLGRWYKGNRPAFSWLPPTALTGLAGYWYELGGEDIQPLGEGRGIWTSKPEAVFPPQKDGVYVFRVVAQDRAGNISREEGRFTVRIDSQAPEAPRVSWSSHPDPETWYRGLDLKLRLESEDHGSGLAGFYCLVDQKPETKPGDGEGLFVDPGDISLPTLPEGENYVHITAVDHAGNFSEAVHRKVRVSLSAPPPMRVHSLTHTDPERGSPNRIPTFAWERPKWGDAEVPGFYWVVDDRPDTVPSEKDGHLTLTTLTSGHLVDGVWYFHIVGADNERRPGTEAVHFKFKVESSLPVKGILLRKDGKTPVAGLPMRIEGQAGSWTAVTGSDGKFDFGGLPAVDLRLSYKLDDKPPLSIELPAGHPELGDLVLGEELVLFPQVISQGGFTLYYYLDVESQVTLEVFGPDGKVVTKKEMTKQGGVYMKLAFDLSKLPAGDYTLKLTSRPPGGRPKLALRKFTIR